ncbi:hypothetical protein [Mycobacterium lepromatosis]|nr:hypothetical protein [Mycobacterium lepromatosis]
MLTAAGNADAAVEADNAAELENVLSVLTSMLEVHICQASSGVS